MKITQAVILAGGQGSRLRPFTFKKPKPLVPVNKKPFLEHLLQLLKENDIKEVLTLTGYLGDKIHSTFPPGLWNGININYSHLPFLDNQNQEIKSGLRIKTAEKQLDDLFLLLYCDNFWPLQLNKLNLFFKNHPSDMMMTAFSNKDNSTKNNIFVNERGYVSNYDKTRQAEDVNGVDAGFFLVKKKVLKLLPNQNIEFETIIPKLIEQGKVSGYLTDQKYYSIGDPKRLKITAKYLKTKKVIFLDRDGVINKKPKKADYVKSWEEFEFLPNSIQAISLLKEKGYKIFIISNQAGIARGKMSHKDLKKIHQKMQSVLKANKENIDNI